MMSSPTNRSTSCDGRQQTDSVCVCHHLQQLKNHPVLCNKVLGCSSLGRAVHQLKSESTKQEMCLLQFIRCVKNNHGWVCILYFPVCLHSQNTKTFIACDELLIVLLLD